jgi:hypothetical protein
MRKKYEKKFASLKSLKKGVASRSISQRYESDDPDPHQCHGSPTLLTSLFFTEQDAVSLSQRPFLHCSSLPLVLLLLLLAGRVVTGNLLRFGLLLFSSLFSHHLRDATRRGLWFIGKVFFFKREN